MTRFLLSFICILAVLLLPRLSHALCVNDKNSSLLDRAVSSSRIYNTIPKEFKIDPHKYSYKTNMNTLDGRATEYTSPDTDGRYVLDSLGSPYTSFRGKAICRVQAPDQKWWLVLQDKNGDLSYLRQDESIVVQSVNKKPLSVVPQREQ